jgi:hypothetical protein
MAAPLALGRRQNWQAGPAQTADDSGLEPCEQPLARNAAARKEEIEGAAENLTDDARSAIGCSGGGCRFASRSGSIYRSDCRITSRSGSIPNHL